MKTIDQDIKNKTFKNVYLFYGEEAYLKKQYKDKLKTALAQEGDTMNVASYEGKAINPKEIIGLAETLPFFAERRVILIENSGFFKNSSVSSSDNINSSVLLKPTFIKRLRAYPPSRPIVSTDG